MSYLPFARKYRPQTFEELIGQPHVTATLSRAIKSKRIAQAYLFAGQRGVGKTSAARILAKSLNCERGPTATPCQTCASCTQITEGRSLDVIEIDGASNRGIDEIRSLRETVPFAPTSGPFRLYIIDEVHMLTTEAFNALLKTIEEPPAHVKFIFATTAANKVPATIISRCQRFDFRRVDTAMLVEVMGRVSKAEKLKIDAAALYAIARAAEGSLRDAEVILEQLASFADGRIKESDVTELLGAVESEALFAWGQAILDHNAAEALGQLTSQLEQGRDPAQLLTSLLHHMRNLLIISSTRQESASGTILERLIDEPTDRITRLTEQASRSSPQELLLILQLLAGAYELVRRSPMSQTILELVVIKLATRERWESIDQISRRLEQLSAGGAGPVGGSAGLNPAPQTAPPPKQANEAQASVSHASATEAPSGQSDLAAFTENWPAFLERLGSRKMSLAAFLAESRPMQLAEGTLTVGLPPSALHEEVLSRADHCRLIEQLLSEMGQGKITVRYATVEEQPPDAAEPQQTDEVPDQAPGIVKDIVKLFNATVERPRPT